MEVEAYEKLNRADRIRVCFAIDPNSASGLTRIYSPSPFHQRYVGKQAGNICSEDGYYQVSFEGKRYKVHHIVAMLADLPRWKEMRSSSRQGSNVLQVDHLDENPRNNDLSNLEIVTIQENLRRSRCRRPSDYGL